MIALARILRSESRILIRSKLLSSIIMLRCSRPIMMRNEKVEGKLLNILIIFLYRHPTALARSNCDVYGKVNVKREVEKSFILPDITRSIETIEQHTVVDTIEEYKDISSSNCLNTTNSKSSLRSCDPQNRQKAKYLYNKKNKLMSKNMNQSYKDTNPKYISPNESQYVERVYKKQKCSFVHLNKNGRKGLKGAKIE
jgi:hypothetical protein